MSRTLMLSMVLTPALFACRSTPAVVDADPEHRELLLDAITALEGRWEGEPEEEGGETPVHEFRVTSAGSAVQETMFPDTEHEMVNLYTLDGNALAMTHYCAGGNQPHMRAASVDGGRIAFRADGVSDLKSADEVHMAEMTLVLVDEDHIEQRWKALSGDEVHHESTFVLHRVR